MFIPIRTDSPLRRTPYMNWALILANVAVFIFVNVLQRDHGEAIKIKYWLNPGDPHLINYFTSLFLHESIGHIGGNMLFLYIFGNNVNDRLGQLGYLAFYLAGGVFSGIGYVMFSHVPVLGASGAISAVTGAYLVLLPRSHITIFYFFFYIGTLEIPGLWFVLIFFVQDLVGVLRQYAPEFLRTSSETAHLAHISGTVFGAGVCMILLATRMLPRDPFDILSLGQRWNRRRQYRDLVARGYNPFEFSADRPPDRVAAPASAAPPDPRTQRILELRAQIGQAIANHDMAGAAALYLQLKEIDPAQVLGRQAQLDVSNQLASQQMYTQAAEAYELFLRTYPNFEQIEQVELMLGVVYARYLRQYERARQLLLLALARLHTDREIEWAKAELSRIAPLVEGSRQ
jgi:membrane associated rhomboid family serine protease